MAGEMPPLSSSGSGTAADAAIRATVRVASYFSVKRRLTSTLFYHPQVATQRQPQGAEYAGRCAGKVFLVGAGPGDAGLITWRGVECLRQADAVLYDYLVNPAILRHTLADCNLICLGRHRRHEGGESPRGERIWPQAEINERLVQLARSGQRVVRLKGGDPAIFGRLAEEVATLETAGIEYEIVPGITAAQAAGPYAGVWITQRDVASAVAFVTGREGDSQDPPQLDYAALAAFPGTLVFYMGVTTARMWTAALVTAGKAARTPAAIVRRCSWPDQEAIRCTLGTIADAIEASRLRPPVAIIVGDVVATASPEMTWFTRRPLFGKRILLTRPIDRTDALFQPLAELGADCLVQPAIAIARPADWQPVDAALARLSEFDWLVFSSVNGVQFLLDRLRESGRDLRHLAGVKLAAIGPGTAEELAKYHLHVDGQPAEVYRAEALAELLAKDARGKRFLLARASRGREVLAETLRAAGGQVEQIVVYSSTDVEEADPEIAAAMKSGHIDWITVTSSAIARSLAKMFGQDLHQTKIASISPVTTSRLGELGFKAAAEARHYTMRGVVEAILEAEGKLH
jgi:uroporphyrinogen III methyltransferase / synthase